MSTAFDQSALSVAQVFAVVLGAAFVLLLICYALHALRMVYQVWRAKRRLESNIAYAIRNDQGYWVGIWNDKRTADDLLKRSTVNPHHGERVVKLLVLD